VPLAKAPTQRKRTTKIPSVPWDQKTNLPAQMPPNFAQLIMNRVFKSKICAWVASELPSLVELGKGRSLVIDYDGLPMQWHAGDVQPTIRTGHICTGESDVKFCQYLNPGQTLLCDSVDGDYVIIALCQIAKALAANETPPNILIRRLEIKTAAEKRKRSGPDSEGATRRQYEIVDVNMVFKVLSIEIRKRIPHATKGLEIPIFSYLVALTGCDFCQGIPRCGPLTIWKNLEKIWPCLEAAYDSTTKEFNVAQVGNKVIAPLLYGVYKKHAGAASGQDLSRLLSALKNSKSLSEKARSDLATVADIACVVRNSNWTLRYWQDAPTAPSSAQIQYGFSVKKNGDIERDPNAVLGL
jgi:hypothetical protein